MADLNFCSVKDCGNKAVYKVFLYDLYIFPGETREFYEIDLTCPRLCQEHKDENENKAIGTREPRGSVRYPHSNQHLAQGYTKYEKLEGAE